MRNLDSLKADKTRNKALLYSFAVIIVITLFAAISFSCAKGTKPSSEHPADNNPLDNTQSTANTDKQDNKIEMIGVVTLTYDEAVEILRECGFTNIVSNFDSIEAQKEWIVIEQSVAKGKMLLPDDQIELICAYMCRLDLSLSSDGNLMFSTYDMTISLDDKEIGTVSNGETFTYSGEVLNGEHKLTFCKLGEDDPNCSRTFMVSGDTSYKCDIAHGSTSIEIKNESITSIQELVMIDVTEKILSEAEKALQAVGLSNVRGEPYGSIWDKDNWIVISQSVAEGTLLGSNAFIQLDCIKLDEYFEKEYVGKTINEIEELAKAKGFSVRFDDKEWNDMNSRVAAMDEKEKEDWIATEARQSGAADKTAAVTIEYIGEPIETPKPTSQPTEEGSAYYSTNTSEEAREGNSGVFAYRSRGKSYDIYYVIDFDKGYVYYFTDGNGEISCERIKMVSGDLNSVLIITYHDGDSVWSNGLHFKWKRNPYTLIVEDQDHFEWEYSATYLSDALNIMKQKTIVDY